MAVPTLLGVGTIVTANSGTTLASVPYPASIAADDIAIVHAGVVGTTTLSCGTSGWAEVTGSVVSNGTLSEGLFWKRLVGGDGSPTVTSSATLTDSITGGAHITVWRGCVTSGDPWEDLTLSALTASATLASSTIDTTGDDRLVVCFGGMANDAVNPADWSTLPDADWSLADIDNWNFTGDGTILAVYKSQASAGTVTSSNVGTYTSTGTSWRTYTLALIPPSGPVSTILGLWPSQRRRI